MLRRERIRKKRIKQTGWQILEEGRLSPGNKHFILLQKAGSPQQLRVEASSLARAYQQAEVLVGAHRRE